MRKEAFVMEKLKRIIAIFITIIIIVTGLIVVNKIKDKNLEKQENKYIYNEDEVYQQALQEMEETRIYRTKR